MTLQILSKVLKVTTYCITDLLEAPVNIFGLDSKNCKSNYYWDLQIFLVQMKYQRKNYRRFKEMIEAEL